MDGGQEVTTTKKQELAPVAPNVGGNVMAFIPTTPEQIKWTVGMVVGAGLAPDSFNGDQKKMAVAIMKGLEIGVPPLTALANIAIINGRPSIWGDLAVALVQRQNLIAEISNKEFGTEPGENAEVSDFKEDFGVEVRIRRKGQDGEYVGRFTVGDAKRAKLWMNPKKAPWMQYPRRMLLNRARAFALRDGFADCLAGLYIREELEDLPPAPAEQADTSFLDDDAPTIEGTAEPAEETIVDDDDTFSGDR